MMGVVIIQNMNGRVKMKKAKYIEVDGEMIKQEIPVFTYCDCVNEKLQIVPTTTDDEGLHVCQFCESYVVWTNQDEISNNGRR